MLEVSTGKVEKWLSYPNSLDWRFKFACTSAGLSVLVHKIVEIKFK